MRSILKLTVTLLVFLCMSRYTTRSDLFFASDLSGPRMVFQVAQRFVQPVKCYGFARLNPAVDQANDIRIISGQVITGDRQALRVHLKLVIAQKRTDFVKVACAGRLAPISTKDTGNGCGHTGFAAGDAKPAQQTASFRQR